MLRLQTPQTERDWEREKENQMYEHHFCLCLHPDWVQTLECVFITQCYVTVISTTCWLPTWDFSKNLHHLLLNFKQKLLDELFLYKHAQKEHQHWEGQKGPTGQPAGISPPLVLFIFFNKLDLQKHLRSAQSPSVFPLPATLACKEQYMLCCTRCIWALRSEETEYCWRAKRVIVR